MRGTWKKLNNSGGFSTCTRYETLLTNSMRHSTYSEGNSSSANQEIPRPVRTLQIHYCVHKRTSFVLILSQINIVHILPYHLFYFPDEALGCGSRNDKLHSVMLRNLSLYQGHTNYKPCSTSARHKTLYDVIIALFSVKHSTVQ
jgi:hypothetical protein